MLNAKKLVLFICCFLFLLFVSTCKVTAAPSTERFGGDDRYDTSIQISKNNWNQSDYVVIVSGENFPDALCAAPLAKKYNSPILLTQNNSLDDSVLQEIQRLNAKNAFIIGGTSVVSQNIEGQLNNLNIHCTRIEGQDRYETSVKVSQIIGTSNGVVIASGENFPDAISVAPIAAANQMPILLTTSDRLPDSVKNFISNNNISKYYVVGGTSAISDNAISNLNNYKRLSGDDRYGTNSAIVNEFIDSIHFNHTYLANGEGFADALSGSAAAAMTSSPIILLNSSNTKEPIIQSNLNAISTVDILGGSAAIPDTLVQNLLFTTTSVPSEASSPSTTSSSIIICIDPGHGGYDSGAVGPTGTLEKNVTLAVALKVGKILESNNVQVIYTRTSDNVPWPSDVAEDLQMRCDISNNSGANYFVCIHANSADDPTVGGTETYYFDGSTAGEKLAQSIQEELVKTTGLQDRGIKTADYYVLKNTNSPAILTELAFISNPKEEALLASDNFQNECAQAIAAGIMENIH
ncbi:cell wall-binding repeat-containing protein [Clostridium sp. WILCCON 0269]|uniref:Cell wall-binding repeat-containing protein n=1 Tax=Candidatus Clostridium eludens TaxID=3381663 RepID=A0ABW8SHQ0_9CLOT